MNSVRRTLLPVLLFGLLLLIPQLAVADPGGFHLTSGSLVVHEDAGDAVITVQRSDTRREGYVGYVAVGPGHPCGPSQCSAQYDWDFTFVQGTLTFPAGVTTASFEIPIIDHHAATIPQTIEVSIYGGWPGGTSSPSTAVVTVLNDDPVTPIATVSAHGDPLLGDGFFVDPTTDAATLAGRYPQLGMIASQPWVERYGLFSGGDVGMAVAHYLARASVQSPNSVPMLSTYRIVSGHCGQWADSPAQALAYHNWIERFAGGIGSYRAVLFLEMDALITSPCLSSHGVDVRMAELRDAISVLTANCPRLVIYLDAGAADAVPAGRIAALLRRAGVANVQGFFLNSTHFDWTSREIRFGEQISRLTAGKHFVVNTGENGRGPLTPPDPVHQGNEVLCNPPGRGLGPKPTANTGYPNVDAFAWILHPGESTGLCGAGAPATGKFWPAYAVMLARNADFQVH